VKSFASDLRQTLRALRASPGLLAACVLSLGLGFGVNIALFAAVRTVFFYEPSIADPERVVAIEPGNSNQFSYLNYRDLQGRGLFEAVAGSRRVQLNLQAGADRERANGLAVTANFFEFVGIPFPLGRPFSADEASAERQPRVVVLSRAFWQRRFGGDPSAVGRAVSINGQTFTVVGVLPDRYRAVTMLQDPDVYVPISALVLPTVTDRNNGNALGVLARLRPGMTTDQARAALIVFGRQLEQAYPTENAGMGRSARVVSLSGGEFAGSAVQFVAPAALLGLFSLILLSGCANLAGLLLARAARREREFAIRVALGARRLDVVRLLLTESFALAALGMLAGVVFAVALVGLLNSISIPGAGSIGLTLAPSTGMAAWSLALLLVTGLLCGVPAWRTTRRDVASVIQGSGSQSVTARLRLRHAFVIAQVAACLILLVLSSLTLRSLMRVAAMDPGFDADRGVVATIHLNADRYAADGGLPLAEQLVQRLTELPGVESAAFANILPLGGETSATRPEVQGVSDDSGTRSYLNNVSAGYFATLGIPILRGRDFSPNDRQGAPPVAIVTESFERAYFRGETAVGKRVRRVNQGPYAEIVGVVRDHMYGSYGDASTPILYAAYTQQPQLSSQIRPVVMHLRVAALPGAALRDVQRIITASDPSISADVTTLRQAIGSEAALRRFGGQLLASAGMLGLFLAAFGLYSTMAFVVAARTSEIGVRIAIGATTAQILRGVLGQGMRLVGIGAAIGVTVSLVLARLAVGLLAGLSPADPMTFVGVAALLFFVGAAACYAPARRASSVDPIVALRRL